MSASTGRTSENKQTCGKHVVGQFRGTNGKSEPDYALAQALSLFQFLRELKTLLESQVKSGSVFITQKRCKSRGLYSIANQTRSSTRVADGSLYLADTYEDAATSNDNGDGQDEPMPAASTSSDTGAHKEYPCIIKATNGKSGDSISKKIKISTLVQPSDTDSFALAYGSILKTHFAQTMRKKSKKRKDKEKEKLNSASTATVADSKKKRRQTKGGLPKVSGSRRGAGHSKRQRSLKARARAAKKILAKRSVVARDEKILAKLPKKADDGKELAL